MKRLSSLFLIGLVFPCGLWPMVSRGAEAERKHLISKTEKMKLQLRINDFKRSLVSLDAKTDKELKSLQIQLPDHEGQLFDWEVSVKEKNLEIIRLKGSNGDDAFFELVAWNSDTGAIVQLFNAWDADLVLKLENDLKAVAKVTQIPDAANDMSVTFRVKPTDTTCAERMAKVEKLFDQMRALVKKSGPVLGKADSKKLEDLHAQIRKHMPHQVEVDLANLSSVTLSCR